MPSGFPGLDVRARGFTSDRWENTYRRRLFGNKYLDGTSLAQNISCSRNLKGGIMRKSVKIIVTMLLALSLSSCTAMTGKTAGENVDDANVTAAVKSQLVMEKAANLTRIDVDTNNGVVHLNGVVDSPEQKARAQELARRVNGVKKVVNDLQVARR
jgi:hyperosmotically inducible protein